MSARLVTRIALGLVVAAFALPLVFPKLLLKQEWNYMGTMRGGYAGTWVVDPAFAPRIAELGAGFDRLTLSAVEHREPPWSTAELTWNGRRLSCVAEMGPFLRFGELLEGAPFPGTMNAEGVYVHAFSWKLDEPGVLLPLAVPALAFWSWSTHDSLFVEARAGSAGRGAMSEDPARSDWIRFVRAQD